ncbi:MAG: hypothetical protein H6636_01670 [Anaerolineales bacterium]|nr:hypothetical protein [Anaerolineales bacterium]
MKTSSAPSTSLALVGDAALFAAATFCLLAVAGAPLALIIGPAVAWLLHGRRFNWKVTISELAGIVVGLVIVGGTFSLLAFIGTTIRSQGGSEFTVPLIFLITASTLLFIMIVALDLDSLRDLTSARREHLRLDYARLVSTAIIVIFAILVTVIQLRQPDTEIGDAGVFAIASAAVGGVTMWAMRWIYKFWEGQNAVISA